MLYKFINEYLKENLSMEVVSIPESPHMDCVFVQLKLRHPSTGEIEVISKSFIGEITKEE